jgi:hypothetical protein
MGRKWVENSCQFWQRRGCLRHADARPDRVSLNSEFPARGPRDLLESVDDAHELD